MAVEVAVGVGFENLVLEAGVEIAIGVVVPVAEALEMMEAAAGSVAGPVVMEYCFGFGARVADGVCRFGHRA